MTGSFDDYDREEQALRHALHGKVDQMTSSPLATRDVHDRARGIRRRRTAMAGAGIAAALAIIVPTAMFAGAAFDDDTTPPITSSSPSPTQATDPTQSPTEPDGPVQGIFDVNDLPEGAAPAVDYAEVDEERGGVDGGVIHTTDGREVDLPSGRLVEFAALGDGWVVDMADSDDATERVYLLDSVGNYSEPWDAMGGLAVAADGSAVAWVGADQVVRVASPSDVLELGAMPDDLSSYSAAGVVGPDCSSSADCTVLVNDGGVTPEVFEVSADRVRPVGDYTKVTSSRGSLVAAVSSVDDLEPSSCSDVLDVVSGDVAWHTCDNTMGAFSPDGGAVVGLEPYLSGIGSAALDVLDAGTGRPLLELAYAAPGVPSFSTVEAWEDDDHLLSIVWRDNEFSIVRIALDGSMEYAVAPVKAGDADSQYRLPTR